MAKQNNYYTLWILLIIIVNPGWLSLRGDIVAFLEKVFKKQDEFDIEGFLNNLDVEEEAMYEDADAFVKPISLERDTDKDLVVEEVKKGNIILLNISELAKRNAVKLRDLINAIKAEVEAVDGDIARISSDRVIVTPSKVKIIKKREGT